MPRLALLGSLCTTLLAALPAAGGTILYATAASLNRVDGFCVGAGGGFVPGAMVRHADTGGTEPRRLLVANGVLYGSEQLTPGRIANFPIDAGGGLGHDPTECSGQRPKVCNAGSRAGQVCTTDDTTGCPGATCPACCTVPRVCQGGSRAGQVCTTDGTKDPTTGCPGAACPGCCVAATAPLSNRPRIQRPRSFRIIGDRIFVEEVGTKRIKAFRLEADGLFPQPPLGKR